MNKIRLTALAVLAAGVPFLPVLSAQSAYETCDVTIVGENRGRYVAGDISAECPSGLHSLSGPWGNWGVRSNYGGIRDSDQFKGWHAEDNKLQWNSCTTDQVRYPLGNSKFYNASNHTAQASPSTAQHGVKKIRVHVQECPSVDRPGSLDDELQGCSQENGYRIKGSNHMEIKELDHPDGDSAVDHLYFPSTSVTLSNCDESGCTGGTTDWVSETSSEVSAAIVRAKLRMRVSALKENFCDLPE